MNERRNSVVFYENWHLFLKQLKPEQYVEAMDLIMNYALDGVFPETKDTEILGLLIGIIPIIDNNNKKFINAKKGGRPKKAKVMTDEDIPT